MLAGLERRQHDWTKRRTSRHDHYCLHFAVCQQLTVRGIDALDAVFECRISAKVGTQFRKSHDAAGWNVHEIGKMGPLANHSGPDQSDPQWARFIQHLKSV